MAEKVPDSTTREEQFLTLFAASQRRLHAYILALVFDPNVAADILQEANIVLWKKFDQFELGTNFFAWAREIARLAVLRHRQSSSSRIVSLDPNVLEQLASNFAENVQPQASDQATVLNECLSNLRPTDRELILSRYTAGASVAGIADRLNRTANSVSQSLCRIRRSLMECAKRRMQNQSPE